MRVLEFYETYYRPLRLMGRSWRTKELYEVIFRALDSHLGRAALMTDLTDGNLAALAEAMLASQRSPATVNKYLRHLKAFWRFAATMGQSEKLPLLRPLPLPKDSPDCLSFEELECLLEEASKEPGMVGRMPAKVFFPALPLFVFDTGIRKGAMMGLKCPALDIPHRVVRVAPELQKTRQGQLLGVSEQFCELIAPWHRPYDPNAFLFDWTYDGRSTGKSQTTWTWLNKRFKRIYQRAGIDTKGGIFHPIRRLCATMICKHVGLAEAKQQLGHKSEQVTIDHYINPSMLDGVTSYVDQLPRPRMKIA